MRRDLIAFLALAASLGGCLADAGEDGPVLVIQRGDAGGYELAPTAIPGFVSDPLASAHFHFIEGAVHDYEANRIVEPGRPMHGRFAAGSPLVPVDYETLVAVSALADLERAYDFFASVWDDDLPPLMQDMPVYFYPESASSDPLEHHADNAAYWSDFQVLDLWPDRLLSRAGVPMAANPSVLTHELGHGVVDLCTRDILVTELAEFRALHEGLADSFAVALLVDPDSLAALGDDGRALADTDLRDVSQPATYAEAAAADIRPDYRIGTVVARTFWLVAQARADALGGLAPALRHGAALAIRALRSLDSAGVDRVLTGFFGKLLALPDLAPADHDAFCAALAETFPSEIDQLEACP